MLRMRSVAVSSANKVWLLIKWGRYRVSRGLVWGNFYPLTGYRNIAQKSLGVRQGREVGTY